MSRVHRVDRQFLFSLFSILLLPIAAYSQFTFTTLKSFVDGSDGREPMGPLVQGTDGWIYGLTNGHNSGCVSVFRFDPGNPTSTFQTLYVLTDPSNNGTGCGVSDGGLAKGGDGNLYFSTF